MVHRHTVELPLTCRAYTVYALVFHSSSISSISTGLWRPASQIIFPIMVWGLTELLKQLCWKFHSQT